MDASLTRLPSAADGLICLQDLSAAAGYRPGRNLWLVKESAAAAAAAAAAVWWGGSSLLYLRPPECSTAQVTHSQMDWQAAYGRSSGRCRSCPHIALAWLGFLLSRLLDMVLVALLALLWMGLGWLKASHASTAVGALKGSAGSALKCTTAYQAPSSAKTWSAKLQKFEDSYQEKRKRRVQEKQQRQAAAGPSRLSRRPQGNGSSSRSHSSSRVWNSSRRWW